MNELLNRVQYTLEPLINDGRNCLVCGDIKGLEWVALEWVEFYYGGSPWQRITRQSDDIFALAESEVMKWPALERIAAARFRYCSKDDYLFLHNIVTCGISVLSFGHG